jgi:hypothetical protein
VVRSDLVIADLAYSRSQTTAHRDVPATAGSNDITNLWFQPATNVWNGKNYGYHEKDDLEAWICQQIKMNRLDPRETFDKLTTDWVKYYEEVKSGHQSQLVE